MLAQRLVSGALALASLFLFGAAVVHERRMHAHRQPGVTYAAATWRRDGGWRRTELFTAEGLRHQRRAARYGAAGAASLLASVLAWVALGTG